MEHGIHSCVNAFCLYMTVGALDLETGSTKNFTAQRPGPWDRDSNSGLRLYIHNILYNVCYSKIYYVANVHITNIFYEI